MTAINNPALISPEQIEVLHHKPWEAPNVPRVEIGEMNGRMPENKFETVAHYASWLLGDVIPKVMIGLTDVNEPVPAFKASPATIDEAYLENEKFDWMPKFNQIYPDPSVPEIEKIDFNDIVCLPAVGRNHEDWIVETAFLGAKLGNKAKIHVIDSPNVGSRISENSAELHTFETLAEQVASKIIKLQKGISNKKFTVIGHSKGGLIAAFLAKNHPGLVSNIICLSPPFKPKDRTPAAWMLPSFRIGKMLHGDKLLDFIETNFRIKREAINGMLKHVTVEELLNTYLHIPEIDWVDVLTKISPDIRIVQTKGRKDSALDGMGFEAGMARDNATLIGFPDKGHGKPDPEIIWRIVVGEQKKLSSAK